MFMTNPLDVLSISVAFSIKVHNCEFSRSLSMFINYAFIPCLLVHCGIFYNHIKMPILALRAVKNWKDKTKKNDEEEIVEDEVVTFLKQPDARYKFNMDKVKEKSQQII